jgi:hypothetical protein
VVIAALAPAIGGYSSAYPVLADATIGRFGPPPEIETGLLADQSEALLAEAGLR